MKSENEKLRGLLQQAIELIEEQEMHIDAEMLPAGRSLVEGITAALSQQAEPTDTFTAVDMATAAAQGFRDGQAAVEQAAAQDGREFNTSDSDLTELLNIAADMLKGVGGGMDLGIYFAAVLERVEQRLAARPAQTEQEAEQSGLVPEGYALVPITPTEDQWSGLARDLMMWLDMNDKTAQGLFLHLRMLGVEPPQWLRDEPEMQGTSVPSKGTRVTLIYRAMIEDYLSAQRGKE